MPASVTNLTIDNALGVTLGTDVTVTGTGIYPLADLPTSQHGYYAVQVSVDESASNLPTRVEPMNPAPPTTHHDRPALMSSTPGAIPTWSAGSEEPGG